MKLLIIATLVLLGTIHAATGYSIFDRWWHPHPCRNGTSQPEVEDHPWWFRIIFRRPCIPEWNNSSSSGGNNWNAHHGNNSWSHSFSTDGANNSSSNANNGTDTN
uniref:Salivary secreted peptide n=1 Tax=Ochlerotatus triseriatus TaxID=7162 RepID=C6ZQY1_OCHTR